MPQDSGVLIGRLENESGSEAPTVAADGGSEAGRLSEEPAAERVERARVYDEIGPLAG